jgi:ASC-1-like (ASCH) protein
MFYHKHRIMANSHLVILKKPYLQAILTGRKKIESRFTKTKRLGFGKVSVGDKLFLKESSGLVCATVIVEKVEKFEFLTPEKILELKRRYNYSICGSDKYWQSKLDCRFGFLVWLKDVTPIEPVRICKKDWRAWITLTEKENFGLFRICRPEQVP